MLDVGKIPLLSREEERALAEQLTSDDRSVAREAAKKLVASNLRFVIKVAFEYKNYNIRMTDLVQEGNVGLMHAVSRFDPERGYRLISYAVWWIKAYIQNYIIKNWSLVPVSKRRKLLFGKRHKLPTGEEVTDPATGEQGDKHFLIAAQGSSAPTLGINQKERDLARRDFSLDASVSAENPSTHLMRLPSNAPSAEEDYAREEVRAQVHRAIAGLVEKMSDRDRFILQERLLSDAPLSLAQIGKEYGISRERARQLEARIKGKLKKALAHLGTPEIVVE